MGIKDIKPETSELVGTGDTAFEVGTFSIKGAGGQQLDQGKCIVSWKQEDGNWKFHGDILNSSMPAP